MKGKGFGMRGWGSGVRGFRFGVRGSGFRGGLVLKAHRLVHQSTLGLRVKTKKMVRGFRLGVRGSGFRVPGLGFRVEPAPPLFVGGERSLCLWSPSPAT